jgi:thiaminase (transcriptional activator TenA)
VPGPEPRHPAPGPPAGPSAVPPGGPGTPPPARAGWTGRAWADIAGTYAAILRHPFIQGLTTGDLPGAAFRYYLGQDAHYLREFVRAVALVGTKAPDPAAALLLARHAADGLAAESALHEALAADLGAAPGALASGPAGPTTQAYTSYVIAAAALGDFAEGLAAVLPCLWIYGEVGRWLAQQGSPHPVYQRWIDSYAGPEYAADVAAVLALADAVGEELSGPQDARARARFAAAARYEWMFWDAAWRQESWPL